MAGVTNREFWDFRVKTRAQFTKLAEQIANIDTSGGGGISELTSKMVVDALGYTPYNAANPANYITSAALALYLKTEDAEETYATKDFVDNKLVNYAPLTSVQGFENRIGGLEGAVPRLNARVETVESKVATLNEYVVTGGNNLLNRVNVIEQEYATKTYVDNAIDGIDLSAYLLKADLTKSRIQSTLGISDWALAATKPSYAWSEITSRPTALSQFTDDVVAGNYLPLSGGTIRNDSHTAPLTIASSKETYTGMCFVNKNNEGGYLVYAGGSDYCVTAAGWTATYTLLHSGNIGNYKLSQFTDDVVAGKYLPLSKFQVAEVADPSKVYLQSGIYRQSEGSHLAIGTSGWSQFITLFAGGDNWAQMYFSYDGKLHYRTATFGDGDPANIPWKAIITEKNIGDYNAGSATKLQTPRKLWGNDFDGTANIGGDITLDAYQDGRQLSIQQTGGIKFSTPPDNGWATSLDIYANDKTTLLTSAFGVYGTGEYVRYAFIGGTYYNPNVVVKDDPGYVGIGTTSPTEKLDVAGNVKASGNINSTSITINGVTITASNGTITVNGNVFATGAITAKV